MNIMANSALLFWTISVFILVVNCRCQIPSLKLDNLDDLWNDFKVNFNKTYFGHHETHRKDAWTDNMMKIRKHNEEAENGLHTFFIKPNHLADLSSKSYLRKMVKLTSSLRRDIIENDKVISLNLENDVPDEMDWRDLGFQTRTYNQKDCGSCYAFSVANAVQAQIFKGLKKNIALSEQQIVDCSVSSGNYGCSGGSLRNTLKYLDSCGGLMKYNDYPYVYKQSKCKFDPSAVVVNLTNWAILPARDEHMMKIAVAKIGPLAASINASPHTFQLYHKGVYNDLECSSDKVNHAMLIVGYTKDAWILKNWWGSHWGENGYMLLKRNSNRCGIANFVAYVEV